METLRQYSEIYIGLTTKLLPVINLDISDVKTNSGVESHIIANFPGGDINQRITSRYNKYTRGLQLLTTSVYHLIKQIIPHDAYCVVAFTMMDLYPHPHWNYCFGEADPSQGIGVFSFNRYMPPSKPGVSPSEKKSTYAKAILSSYGTRNYSLVWSRTLYILFLLYARF